VGFLTGKKAIRPADVQETSGRARKTCKKKVTLPINGVAQTSCQEDEAADCAGGFFAPLSAGHLDIAQTQEDCDTTRRSP